VLVDTEQGWRITDESIRSTAAWTPYSGRTVRGQVVRTLLRGRTIFDGTSVAEEHLGRFVPGPGLSR
jgi:allantoinase